MKFDWQRKMLVVVTIVTALVLWSNHVEADVLPDSITLQLDTGVTKVKHSWDDIYGYAMFKTTLKSAGITAWHDSNFGFRIAHGYMSEAAESSGGNYKNVSIDFKHLTSYELMYKIDVLDRLYIYGGIGTYRIPTDHLYYKDGVVVGGRLDSDDDEGYFIGINYRLTEDLGIQWRYTKYSEIGDKEYIEGQSLEFTYRF